MRYLVLLGALALAGCQTTKTEESQVTSLQAACAGADLGYVFFKMELQDKVSKSLAVRVDASYASVKVICANPPTDASTGFIAVMNAVSAFNNSLVAAKASAG